MVKMILVEVTELVYHQIQKVLVDTLVRVVVVLEDQADQVVLEDQEDQAVLVDQEDQVVLVDQVDQVDQVVLLQVVPQHLETLVEVGEGVSQTVHH